MNKVNQFYMNNFSYDLDVGLNEFIMRRYEHIKIKNVNILTLLIDGNLFYYSIFHCNSGVS